MFITLLQYGEAIGLDGTNFENFIEWDRKYSYIPQPGTEAYERRKGLLRELFFEAFTKTSASTENVWVLKNEYYFRLIEYKELQHTRINAAEARKYATYAIIVSVVAMFASVILGVAQMNSEVQFNEDQIARIFSNVDQTKDRERAGISIISSLVDELEKPPGEK